MKKIQLNISEIVYKNLNESRENKLYNSFYNLKDKKGDDLVYSFMNTSINLMNEGYDFDDINNFLYEIEAPKDLLNKVKDIDWKGGMTDALMDSLKEMAYYWILTSLGFTGSTTTIISGLLADLSIVDVLRPFKNKQYCIQYAPKVLDSVLEHLGRWAARKLTGQEAKHETWGDILSMGLGNVLGTIIEKSDTSETIANKLCPMVHK
jgi:hypothetical protein